MKALSFPPAPLLCLGFAAAPFLGLLAGAASARLAPTPQAPAELPEVAATFGDQTISMQAYSEYLVRTSGRRPLDVLIDRRLVEMEAERLGLGIEQAEVEAAVESIWESYLQRVEGDAERLERELEQSGYTRDQARANLGAEARHQLLAQAISQATRTVTEADLVEKFRLDFGEDGDAVVVRHIFLSAARLKADLISEGTPASELSATRLESLCKQRLAEVLERLGQGEDFAMLAASTSHDFAAKSTGGKFANYNYRAYGQEFADAVRAAEVGVPVGPIQTEAGFHVIEVVSRVHTEFADVRDELREQLLIAPASQNELQELVERLRAAVEIQTF